MYSEKELIELIRRRFGQVSLPVGIGDDAAVVDLPVGSSAVLCADLIVENTHFRRSTYPADAIGYKAVAVNVSDVGAMGGEPDYCLLSLAVPREIERAWIDAFFDGVAEACRRLGVRLVGGDVSTAERIFVDVAMFGHVAAGRAVRRRGARPGDGIYVTGTLGGSARGLQLLGTAGPEDPSVRRHLYPEPRHRLAQEVSGRASAMIDVSDGLSVDLGHILEESGVSARIDRNAVPCAPDATVEQALHGGEDYELIITARALPAEAGGVPITRIGEIVATAGRPEIVLVTETGEEVLAPSGWRHFAENEK